MINPFRKTEHNITDSVHLADSKDDGSINRRPNTSRQPTRAELVGQSSDGRQRRSLLPQKLASSSRTAVLQKETHTMKMAVSESIPQTLSATSSNSSLKKTPIKTTASEQNENPAGSKRQELPAKSLEKPLPTKSNVIVSHKPLASRIASPTKAAVASGAQASSLAAARKANVSFKRVSSSVSNLGSIGSEIGKSGINAMNDTIARPRMRSDSQSTQPMAGVSGHHRSSSHQIAKISIPEGTILRPKEAPFQHLPVKVHRPPFSTLHQDLAPRTSTKATTASIRAQSTNVGAKVETPFKPISPLQMELFHLILLHRTAVETQRQWEQSAKQKLQQRYDVVYKEHCRIQALVRDQNAFNNESALISWSENLTSTELAAKVQLLSRNISEIWQTSGPGGDHTNIVNKFKLWFFRARGILDSRKQVTRLAREDINFIESIEGSWARNVEAMQWKLTSSLRELKSIGDLPENTAFGNLLFRFKKLASGLLEEMTIIEAIHTDIIAQEKSWIQARVDDCTQAGDGDMKLCDVEPYRGIWEVAH